MFYKYFNTDWYLLIVFLCNFLLSTILINSLIKLLKKHSKFQPIRVEGPETHFKKAKTPTMGGLAFNLSMLVNMFLFCDLSSYYTWITIFLFVSFSLIGLADDIIKVFFRDSFGFRGSIKLILELLVGIISLFALAYFDGTYTATNIKIPLFNNWLDLGIIAFPFFIMALVGSANATNITDGLDGLLSVPIIIISSFLAIYVIKSNFNIDFSNNIINIILVLLILICSSFIAFLIFNKHPAKIFMGDVGSLSIGALLFFIAYSLKIELFYAIMGLLFIIELTSTTLQILSYKLFKKRIFKMAPIHHHFEKCGWSETKVVKCFWTFSFLVSLCGFLLLLL